MKKVIDTKYRRKIRLNVVLYAKNNKIKRVTVEKKNESEVFFNTVFVYKKVDILYILKYVINKKKIMQKEASIST